MKTVTISRRAADRLRGGHPWVYRSDIIHADALEPGEGVLVQEQGRKRSAALGVGFSSTESLLAVRLASRKVQPLDREFLRGRLVAALELRTRAYGGPQEAFRWVHGEADGIPGLVVDVFGSAVTVQVLAQGTARLQDEILSLIDELRAPSTLVLRNDVPVRQKEGLPLDKRVVKGTETSVRYREGGIALTIDLLGGQKTGTFLDQRDNHVLAGTLGTGRALDCFSGDGGFALQLARRCQSVKAVDQSAPAAERIAQNARDNALGNVEAVAANAFDLLREESDRGVTYDVIVLDPPAFAKGKHNLEPALRGYKELNLRALKMLSPGGMLVTCSCSQPVDATMLLEVVQAAAADAGKDLQVLMRRGAGPDHPVKVGFPESDYLKCFFLRVMG
ncbi:MAG: class I SAM-dependent rRNA methyltransferase [Myxococcota bacterium]